MSTLKKIQSYMTGRKGLLPGALILSAISSLLGMLPYLCLWLIARELFTNGIQASTALIRFYAWWAMGLSIAGVAAYFLALMLSHLAAFRVEREMRFKAMERVIRLPLGFFDNNASGRIRKIIDDNAGITHSFLAHQMPDLAGTLLMPLVSLILIFLFEWRLGLACLVPVLASMGVMSFMMGKRGRTFMNAYMNSLEEMNTEAVEYVRGIPVVKVFQQTVFSFKNFHDSIMRYRDMVHRYTLMWRNPMSVYTVLIHGIVYFLIPAAILMINNGASAESVLLNLFFYILFTPVFSQSIMKSMYINQAMGQASEAIVRTEALMETPVLPVPVSPQTVDEFDIRFTDVSFTYPGSDTKALDSVSFALSTGQTFALVGPSGSGKTTIARLVPRFWDAGSGEVCIGGKNVRDIAPDDLMKHISFVFQNNRLFKTTLRENICYGCPDATPGMIERAVDLSQSREIIDRLPEGLDTMIGSRGTYLSGGEQQRIALARAILKDAPIIVLDEATAFADPENEDLIRKAMKTLCKGKTVIMIAHRLSSVVDADAILVVNEGRISERGRHDELLARKGRYAAMWEEYQKSVDWSLASKELEYV